jgi:hypothetical protein
MATIVITNTEARLYGVNGLALAPGENTVDADRWAEARKHPLVKERLNDGRLKEPTKAPAGKAQTTAKTETPNGATPNGGSTPDGTTPNGGDPAK